MSATKLILVIGATGAQGMAAIDGLLESRDGVPSPYKIRALTRDINGARAKALAAKGVECVQGFFNFVFSRRDAEIRLPRNV
jgi:uncharacterized protein YbjT (DUF2867 family)